MRMYILIGVLLTSFTMSAAVAKDPYPTKSVRLIVGYTPGGASDIIARLVANELSELNGQSFVVENKPGVGGMLGLNQVAQAPADGYTLGFAVSGMLVTGPHLVKDMLYDPLTAFSPISLTTKAPMVMLATPDYKHDTVSSFIAEAKASPDPLLFASGAQAFELAMRLFGAMAEVELESVSYPGGAQAALDVMAGRIPVMVDTIGAQQTNIKSGKLKPIAVLDRSRSGALPEVPTIDESGLPGYEVTAWNGIVAPKGTPEAIITKLNEQIRQVMAMPEIKDKLSNLGFEPISSSPDEFNRLIQSDHAKWGEVVKQAGMMAK